jgi:hypothetical protein
MKRIILAKSEVALEVDLEVENRKIIMIEEVNDLLR